MPERAYIVHQTRGRLRLRIKSKRQDQAYFDELCSRLEALDGIETVRANSNTGSIILRHPESDFSEVENELRRLALFDLAEGPEPETPALRPLVSGIFGLDQILKEESAGVLNLRTLTVVAVALLAIRQIRRGALLGPALPMLWSALELALKSNGLVGGAEDGDA